MRKLYKYLVWFFLISTILSFLITIFERFWIVTTKEPAKIISKHKVKDEIEVIIQLGSENFYLYFDKNKDLPIKEGENVKLFHSKILQVPVSIKKDKRMIKGKFSFSGIIYIEVIVLFFILTSCITFWKRKKGELERDDSLVDPFEFFFYLASIVSIVPWIYIFHKIFKG